MSTSELELSIINTKQQTYKVIMLINHLMKTFEA